MGIGFSQMPGDGQRHGRFPDAAGADDRDETPPRQLSGDVSDGFRPADDTGYRRGYRPYRFCCWLSRRRHRRTGTLIETGDGSQEAIAATRDRSDILIATSFVAQ